MSFNFTAFKPADHETPADSNKQRSFIQAVQDGLNDLPIASLHGYPSDATKFLRGDGNWAVPSGGLVAVYTKVTEKDINNSTTPTDLLNNEITIAGGLVGTTGAIKLVCGGDYLNNSGASRGITLALGLGANTIWSDTSINVAASATRHGWTLEAIIQAAGSTSAQRTGGVFQTGGTSGATTGTGSIDLTSTASTLWLAPFYGATSTDLSSGQTLTLTLTHGFAASTISMRLEWARIEVYS